MRLHRVLIRAGLGLAAAAVTLSVAAGPAVAQTNPFQPKGSATTATTAAATSGGSQSAASGSGATSSSGSASSSTGSSGSAAIVSPSASSSPAMPTTGVEAAHSALVGLACVALGLVLLVAARPRRSPRSGLHLASARTR